MTDSEFNQVVSDTKRLVFKAIGDTLIDRFDDATDDVVQEVYFRVYKALQKGNFDGRSKISTWIYTIARNEAIRMNQKRLREEEKAKRYLDQGMVKTATEEIKDDSDKKEWIESALIKVPAVYQNALRMYLAGHSMEEIAKHMDIKEGTVKSRLFRAKEWIKKNMMRENQNEFQES
ncbi:sigma-70 family RNA polymerase sigma factor [Leptospira sp. 96542]|nr:sigma-70 family RNA polymerase sigma factor [Leptospira sp. 96542]